VECLLSSTAQRNAPASDATTPAGVKRRVIWLRNIVKGMAFLAKRFPGSMAIIATFSIFSGVIPALSAWAGKKIFDDVQGRLQAADRMVHLQTLEFWIAAAVGLGLLQILVRWLQLVSQDWLQRAGSVEIDRMLVDRTQRIAVLTRESPEFADRQMLVQMGTGALSANLLSSTINIGQTLITMLSFAGLLAAFSPGLTLLGIAVGVSFGVIEVRYSKQRYFLSRALIKLRRKLSATRNILTNHMVANEVRRVTTYDRLRSRMLEQGWEARDREHDLEKKTHAKRAAVGSAEVIVSFGVYSALLFRMLRGAITLGDVILYRSAFSTLSGGVQSIGRSISTLLESDLQLQHLFEFLEPGKDEDEIGKNGKAPFPTTLERGVEIRSLEFTYPNMDRPALHQVSLDLPPGQITAIVGPNGSGKSTLLKILAGVYSANPDSVRLEGKPLHDYSGDDYIANVYMWGITSWVHPLTVRENIAFCRFGDVGDDNGLWEAARAAKADDIVARLPSGMETMLTKILDDGQQLSWGQNMRIVLARALFTDARIVLIDEPGTGMDRQSRGELLKLIKQLRQGRIVVIASHDPDVIEIADRIVELPR